MTGISRSTVKPPTAHERAFYKSIVKGTGADKYEQPNEMVFLTLYGTENPTDDDRGLTSAPIQGLKRHSSR